MKYLVRMEGDDPDDTVEVEADAPEQAAEKFSYEHARGLRRKEIETLFPATVLVYGKDWPAHTFRVCVMAEITTLFYGRQIHAPVEGLPE